MARYDAGVHLLKGGHVLRQIIGKAQFAARSASLAAIFQL
jgi:hypothetical protein